jgi:hypothetical protein
MPPQRPPYRPDVPCYTNKLPDLNSARTGAPDGKAAGARRVGLPQAKAGEGK